MSISARTRQSTWSTDAPEASTGPASQFAPRARRSSPALKLGAEALQPVPARPASIAAAGALRHDALEAERAGVGEHDRALASDRFAKLDAVDSATRRERASRRSSRGRWRRSSPSRLRRSKATKEARAPPDLVRRAAKSECPPGRNATASPSIRALSAGKARTASAMFENLAVKSVPYRLHTSTRSPCFRARVRNPSCFTSCSQPARRADWRRGSADKAG